MNEYKEARTKTLCNKCCNEASWCDWCENKFLNDEKIFCASITHLCEDCWNEELENRSKKQMNKQ